MSELEAPQNPPQAVLGEARFVQGCRQRVHLLLPRAPRIRLHLLRSPPLLLRQQRDHRLLGAQVGHGLVPVEHYQLFPARHLLVGIKRVSAGLIFC